MTIFKDNKLHQINMINIFVYGHIKKQQLLIGYKMEMKYFVEVLG